MKNPDPTTQWTKKYLKESQNLLVATKTKKGVCPHAINLKICNQGIKIYGTPFLSWPWSTETAKELKQVDKTLKSSLPPPPQI